MRDINGMALEILQLKCHAISDNNYYVSTPFLTMHIMQTTVTHDSNVRIYIMGVANANHAKDNKYSV